MRGADLRGADLRGMRWEQLDLTGALLQGADLRDARLFGGSLRGAELAGSRWEGAALVGVDGLDGLLGCPELAAAAVVGRDPVEVMVAAPGGVAAVAFSADRRLLAAARGHAVEIVEARTGGRRRVLDGYGGEVSGLAFAPEGTTLATVSVDGGVRIWDVVTGLLLDTLAEPATPYPLAVAFCPGGVRVAVAPIAGPPRVWDLAARTMTVLPGPSVPHPALAFSADGTLLAAAGRWEVGVYEVATGALRTTLRRPRGWWSRRRGRGHAPEPLAVAFTADGARLSTVARDGTEGAWDLHRRTLKETPGVGPGLFVAAAFRPDGEHAVLARAGTHRKLPYRWITAGTPDYARQLASACDTTALACSRDGKRTAVGTSDGHLYVLRDHLEKQLGVSTRLVPGDPVPDLSFSPDGTTLATASGDGTIRHWDVTTGTVTAVRKGREGGCTVAFSPDGATVATVYDNPVRLWETATRELRASLGMPGPMWHSMAYSPDGSTFAVVCNGAAQVWETAGGEVLATLTDPSASMRAAAFTPDGSAITIVGRGSLVRWDLTAKQPHTIAALPESTYTNAVAHSPDGTLLATAGTGTDVRLWDIATMTVRATLSGHWDDVNALAFSPDSTLLATASDDGTARIWDPAAGTARFVLRGHSAAVNRVVFSPDGSRLATCSDDGTARIWDPGTGEPLVRLVPLPGGRGAALFEDGSYRLDGKAGNHFWWTVKLCRFGPGELDPYLPALRRLPAVDQGRQVRRGEAQSPRS